ncbi:dynein light chain Tctex-type 5-A [Hypanus sabinus]|uniref:dynein light chain Tctex-type 5-A n=1 Tax=Hypanus sabinus TaxID=79690 RepID=UPI0028C3E3C0|nr:dynein light chain Tctex-type 5-A [Hypanus sabinus]
MRREYKCSSRLSQERARRSITHECPGWGCEELPIPAYKYALRQEPTPAQLADCPVVSPYHCGAAMESRGFREPERPKCIRFQGFRLPKARSAQISKRWGSALPASEIERQQTRLPSKREKDRQRSKPGNSSTRLDSPTENIYVPRPAKTFSAEEARAAIRSVLESRLNGAKYEPRGSALAAVELAECVKKAVKALGYERYKIVCYLVLGATRTSGLSCSSRAVWSPAVDTYAEFCFQNDSLFALCLVFALYHE